MSRFSTDDDVLCIAHHPNLPQFAISLVTGHVHAYSYTPGDDLASRTTLWSTKRHKKACRALCYSPSGEHIVSAGADGVIKLASSQSGKVLKKYQGAHKEAVNAVTFINIDTFCTADDDGVIKAWSADPSSTNTSTTKDNKSDSAKDSKSDSVKDKAKDSESGSSCMREYSTHDDYVSSLTQLDEKFVLSTSGDGTVAIHDLRAARYANDAARASKDGWSKISQACVKRSDDQEDDLNCSLVLKLGKKEKVLVGTASGVVLVFDRADVGDCNDRILPPPSLASMSDTATTTGSKKKRKKSEEEEIAVECMAKVSDSQIVVGGSDGAVRLLNVLPNRYVRLIGDFETGEPVEGIVVHDEYVIATSGADVQSWPIQEQDQFSKPGNDKNIKIEDKADTKSSSDDDDDHDSSDEEDDDEHDSSLDVESDGNSDDDREDIDGQEKSTTNDEGNGKPAKPKTEVTQDAQDNDEGNQFSDSDSDAEPAPKRKKPKKEKPMMTGKKNTFFDGL